jgi:alpha-beta hydrolase superfamily lysophospholipase
MTESWWPRPAPPDRDEQDPARVVFLLPGLGYSADRPLLHFARAVFRRHGWTTQSLWWTRQPPARDGRDFPGWYQELRSFVEDQLTPILDAEPAPTVALVGKSLGTLAAGPAADRGLAGIWLTPLLRDSGLDDDLRRSPAPYLLVGGTADRVWDAGLVRRLGAPFFEAEGADHGLETDEDPVNSADILRRATIAMDAFVAKL